MGIGRKIPHHRWSGGNHFAVERRVDLIGHFDQVHLDAAIPQFLGGRIPGIIAEFLYPDSNVKAAP